MQHSLIALLPSSATLWGAARLLHQPHWAVE